MRGSSSRIASGATGNTARRLGSVALRYRWPAGARPRRRWATPGSEPEAQPPEPATADPLARDERMARLEAVLFLAREPLNSRRLAQLAGLADGTEARTLIRRLNRYYDEGHTAFRAEEVAGGFQLMTRPKFGGWLRRLYQSPIETRLSAPALETLAVVAYRQPALRAEVEAIRGVDCGEILRQLMERDLIRILGRSDDLGRPFVYGTTKRFLQVFGLRQLDDLPRAAQLRSAPAQWSAPAAPDDADQFSPPERGADEPSGSFNAPREEE